MRWVLALVQSAALIGLSLPAVAQTPDPELAQGVKQVREGDFEGAVVTLEAVVRRLASVPQRSADLVQAYVQLGVAYVALDQADAARSRFREALARDRGLRLSPTEYSPKVREVFEAARREAPPPARPRKGSRAPLIAIGIGAAAAGVVLATRSGSEAPPAFSGARFGTPVVVCPDGSINVDVPVRILVEAQAGGSSLTISASATLHIVSSAEPGEVGFGSSRGTTVTPAMLASKSKATLAIDTTLLCNNGPGDPGRFNEWSGQVTLTTSAGVFTVETADSLRVNIP
ncbi:MAG: hypothetical protein DMF80_20925 [Acidobacteria bacterium]|nr:MAG: hypothetical protein DMF80_20925 [Acidobacteriota bacterium]PYQ24261.1 MAG: hypothetical protein DMF81_06005 [Acidobacteriota bacterium]